ncbi:hypothetical protein ACIB24_07845 [Spongisporangium articulatum]|uniref:Uncharacterized protein n=1 Tax=Spongisporangium articulatum TaxID=3362603 RepID=A0ABW8ALX1_9ACTN
MGRHRARIRLYVAVGFLATSAVMFGLAASYGWQLAASFGTSSLVSGFGSLYWWRFPPEESRTRRAAEEIKAENLARLREIEAEDRRRIASRVRPLGGRSASNSGAGRPPR